MDTTSGIPCDMDYIFNLLEEKLGSELVKIEFRNITIFRPRVFIMVTVKTPRSFDDFTAENYDLWEKLCEYECNNGVLFGYIMGTKINCNYIPRKKFKDIPIVPTSLYADERQLTDEDFFEFSEEMTNLPEEALFYSAQKQHDIVEAQMKERIRNAIEFHQDNEPIVLSKRLHLPLDFVVKLKPVKTFKEGKNLYFNYMLEKFKFARGKLDTGASIKDIVAETGLSTEAVTSLQRYSDDESIERKLDELVHWNWNNLYNKDNDDERDEE
ncbi:MAG: hypothetical protein LBT59_07340 [Clostridiales bacterium]|jgi:hypothetical protein|nr:hypothetical protein [Clostridiales bacterium]